MVKYPKDWPYMTSGQRSLWMRNHQRDRQSRANPSMPETDIEHMTEFLRKQGYKSRSEEAEDQRQFDARKQHNQDRLDTMKPFFIAIVVVIGIAIFIYMSSNGLFVP